MTSRPTTQFKINIGAAASTPLANPDEAFGRQYRQQVDGAVTDHGDAGALVHAAGHGGAVAGAEDVRERQQGRHKR